MGEPNAQKSVHALHFFFPDADSGAADVTLGTRRADKVTQKETHFCHPKCIYRYAMTVIVILAYSIRGDSRGRWEEGAHMGGGKGGLTWEVGRGGGMSEPLAQMLNMGMMDSVDY